jgi:hypothetical protein
VAPEVGIAPTSPPLQGGANLPQLLGGRTSPSVDWSSRAVTLRGRPVISRVLCGSRNGLPGRNPGEGWWEVLVTLQSSLPACLKTPDLQAGSRITSREIGSGGGSCAHGGRAYEARLNLILPAVKWRSTKNKHLLVIYSIPARGFTAAVSVFRGTPPPKPLKCKSVSNHLGARLRWRWADPTGEEFVLLCAILGLAVTDILKTSLGYRSQTVHLSLPSFTIRFRETKNPAYTR